MKHTVEYDLSNEVDCNQLTISKNMDTIYDFILELFRHSKNDNSAQLQAFVVEKLNILRTEDWFNCLIKTAKFNLSASKIDEEVAFKK